MTACTRFAPMIGARPGELSDEDARALADHLAECEACQARLADETALSGLLSEALMAEANRRDFARFSDEVLARIPEYASPFETAAARPPQGERAAPSDALRAPGERAARSDVLRAPGERAARSEALRAPGERTPRAQPGFFEWVRHHRALAAFSALAPAAAALAMILYVYGGPSVPPEDAYAVDVTADSGAMILQTSDGPVVLLGDSSTEGS